MPILADYGCNEQEYIDQEKHKDSACPAGCGWCGEEGCLIGHGYYLRKAKDEQRSYFIWVKRWLCKICHRTRSVLPNFLFPYHWFAMSPSITGSARMPNHLRQFRWVTIGLTHRRAKSSMML